MTAPTKVHVEQSTLVHAVGHPCMARRAHTIRPGKVDRIAFEQFLAHDFSETCRSFIRPSHESCRIIEVHLQGVLGCFIISSARTRVILRLGGHAGVVHQQCHGIFFDVGRGVMIVIDVLHVGPIVVRFGEVNVLLFIVRHHGISDFATSLHRPFVVKHDLCHRCSHATGIWIAYDFVVRIDLIPLGCQQRSNCLLCGTRSYGRLYGVRLLLQLCKTLAIGLQQELHTGVSIERIQRSPVAIGKQFAHGIVSGNDNIAFTMHVVEDIKGRRFCTVSASCMRHNSLSAVGSDVFSRDIESLFH